jgi:hypothetical protein
LAWLPHQILYFLKYIFIKNKETQQNDEYLHHLYHLPKTTPLKSNSKPMNQSPKG